MMSYVAADTDDIKIWPNWSLNCPIIPFLHHVENNNVVMDSKIMFKAVCPQPSASGFVGGTNETGKDIFSNTFIYWLNDSNITRQ